MFRYGYWFGKVQGVSMTYGWSVGIGRWWNDDDRIKMERSEMTVLT